MPTLWRNSLLEPGYALLVFSGMMVSALIWSRRRRQQPEMVAVFIGGLIGALIGAKLGYWICELPYRLHQPFFWMNVLVGRTIVGGLLGGYVGVELGKRAIGYRFPTGDGFAIAVPVGLAIGRIGCFVHGCCLGAVCAPAWYAVLDAAGQPRYPAPLFEAGFNLLMAAVLALVRRQPWYERRLRGQLFHIYLIAYGLFRFFHEFIRDTPRLVGPFSSYQPLALALVLFAVWRFEVRRRGNTAQVLPASGVFA